MMTVAAIMAGLLPILWNNGTGSEVMQRIAVPMVGGIVTSTVLTLLVIPAIYALVKGRRVYKVHTSRLVNATSNTTPTAKQDDLPVSANLRT